MHEAHGVQFDAVLHAGSIADARAVRHEAELSTLRCGHPAITLQGGARIVLAIHRGLVVCVWKCDEGVTVQCGRAQCLTSQSVGFLRYSAYIYI